MSRPVLQPTQPPINGYQRLFPWGVKLLRHAREHSPPASTEGKSGWSNPFPPGAITLNVEATTTSNLYKLIHGSIASTDKTFLFPSKCPDQFFSLPSLLSMGISIGGWSCWGMHVSTHHQPVLRVRVGGAITLPILYAFMVWMGQISIHHYLYSNVISQWSRNIWHSSATI